MGKASRRKREQREAGAAAPDPVRSVVDEYIGRLGAMRPCRPGDTDNFWATLDRRYGPQAKRVYDAIGGVLERSDTAVFDAKNVSLGLSLDVAMGYSGDLYRQQMETTARQFGELRPRRVLDAGCENGLLACFYATLWPEATVVGWDHVASATERATELATRLGLENATFELADLTSRQPDEERFDLVCASRALLAEAVTRRHVDYGLTVAEADGIDLGELDAAVATLVAHTSEDGLLVILDRMMKPAEIAAMAGSLERAGAAVNWTQSSLVTADEIAGAGQVFPQLIAHPGAGVSPPALVDAALGYRAAPELAELGGIAASAAEAIARSLRKERLIFSARATIIDDWGEEVESAYEVWDCGAVALNYQANSLGARTAQLLPVSAAADVAAELRRRLEEEAEHDVVFGTRSVVAADPAPIGR